MASEQIIRWIREHLAVIAGLADRETNPERASLLRQVRAIGDLLSQLNVTITCPLKESCPVHVAMIADHQVTAAAPVADPNPPHVRRGD